MWNQTLLVGGNQGAGEQLHLPDNISIAGRAGTLCCMYHALAVVLLCRETAVMALEMLTW